MKRNAVAALLALVMLTAWGQQAKKEKTTEYKTTMWIEVKDHITHETVPDTSGELLLAADSSFVDSLTIGKSESFGTLMLIDLRQPGNYLLRIHARDYRTAYVPLKVPRLYKRESSRQLPTVYLRKLPKRDEHEMDEVVVKATLLKFYMDGDTLVYNADAFSMAEGSMLGDLIKRLPGVEVKKGGIITVNGKQVDAMLLNGKEFFNSDRELLLENMPSYMVKSFHTYERAPEEVRGTAREHTRQKEFVMDVRLKKEYSVGWIANAEAGGGFSFYKSADGHRDGKYLGRLFGLRFTKNSRLTAYLNTNNLTDQRTPGREGDWEQISQALDGLTSAVKFGTNYQYEQDDSQPKFHRYSGDFNVAYTDRSDASQTSSATFLDNGNTFGKSFHNSRNHSWNFDTNHKYYYNCNRTSGGRIKNLYVHVAPNFEYGKWDNLTASGSATLAEDVAAQLGKAWMDSIAAPYASQLLKRYALNRTINSTQSLGHNMAASGNAYLGFNPACNDHIRLTLNADGNIMDNVRDSYSHYRLDYPKDEAQGTDCRNQYNPVRSKAQSIFVSPCVNFTLDKHYNHEICIRYEYSYHHYDDNNSLYLLNRLEGWEQPDSHPLGMLPSTEEMLLAIDRDNSYRSVSTRHYHTPKITYRYSKYNAESKVYSFLDATFCLSAAHQTLNHRQGRQIDTLMTRNTTLPQANVFFQHGKNGGTRSLSGHYQFYASAPSMNSLLDIRNDRNPLYVTLGNPDLKNSIYHNLVASYRDKLGKTLFNTSLRGTLQTRAVAYGFIYDRETGVRTSRPQNVNGNWQTTADAHIDFPLDKADKLRLKEGVTYNYNHSVDLAGTNETMVATRSAVGSHYITDNLSLRYRPNTRMEFGLSGSLTYQNSTSNRESFETLNVFTYNYGANLTLELPWGLQLSSDLTLYARRGYSEASMNTDELVWNARLAKKLMHGNLTLMFDGFDLLGNLSNVRRSINAQGRSETFYNVLPSYGLFHVVYRLNKQPKNKQQ